MPLKIRHLLVISKFFLKNPRIAEEDREAGMNEKRDKHEVGERQVQRVPIRKSAGCGIQRQAAAFEKKFAGQQG